MKLPGPDHPITITANPKRIRVTAAGFMVAQRAGPTFWREQFRNMTIGK